MTKLSEIPEQIQFEKLGYDMMVAPKSEQNRAKASDISSVTRQKGESQNGCFKKTKDAKFSEKRTFLIPLIHTRTCAYQGV